MAIVSATQGEKGSLAMPTLNENETVRVSRAVAVANVGLDSEHFRAGLSKRLIKFFFRKLP